MIPAINEVGTIIYVELLLFSRITNKRLNNELAKMAQDIKRVYLQRRARRMRGGTPRRKADARKRRPGRPMAAAKGYRLDGGRSFEVSKRKPVMPNASTAQTQQKMKIGPSSVGLRQRVEKTRPSGNRDLQNESQNTGRYRL